MVLRVDGGGHEYKPQPQKDVQKSKDEPTVAEQIFKKFKKETNMQVKAEDLERTLNRPVKSQTENDVKKQKELSIFLKDTELKLPHEK